MIAVLSNFDISLVCRPCYKQLDTVGSRQDKFLYCAGSGHWLVGGELGAEAGGLLLNTSQVTVTTIVISIVITIVITVITIVIIIVARPRQSVTMSRPGAGSSRRV